MSRLREWLRQSLSSELSQRERERDKIAAEISRAIGSLLDFCGQLSRKAEQDMESKRDNRARFRAGRAVVRLTTIIAEMCGEITVPGAKDSASLRNVQRVTSRLASESARAREEWLRQIRPYYILDMMTIGGNIDKIRRLSDEVHGFLVGRGLLLRSLEELDEKLDSFTKLQELKDSLLTRRHTVKQKLAEADEEQKSLTLQVQELQGDPKMREYFEVETELRGLRVELLHTGFSRLGRPFRKLLSVSERGDYPLPIDVRESMKEYTKKPFATFLRESDGYPKLKAVMSALSKAVSSGKLALKQREAKKVIERTEQVVSADSLAGIHVRSRELKSIYRKLVADGGTASLVQRIKETRQKMRESIRKKEELAAELERTIEREEKIEEQITQMLKDIETFTRRLTGAEVKLQFS